MIGMIGIKEVIEMIKENQSAETLYRIVQIDLLYQILKYIQTRNMGIIQNIEKICNQSKNNKKGKNLQDFSLLLRL